MECFYQVRKLGASDKFFYYVDSGPGMTMDIKLNFSFNDDINFIALEESFGEAMKFFPEFAVRPVIKNGDLFYSENDNAPSFIKITSDDFTVNFGSNETNGYLLCFMYKESDRKNITLSFFHGLSDVVGFYKFVKTMLYLYAVKINPETEKLSAEDLAASGIRLSVPENWNSPENLDPYNFCGDEKIEPSFTPDLSNVFPLPVKLYDVDDKKDKCFKITLKLSGYLKKTKELHTSFSAYFLYLMAQAVKRAYNTEDKNIIFGLPVNLRAVYNTDCAANFSDNVILTFYPDDFNLSAEALCSKIKASINSQRKPENYSKALFMKAKQVEEFDKNGDIIKKSCELTSKQPDVTKIVTFGVTYIGKLDLPENIKFLVNDISFDMPFGVSFFLVYTFGDLMTVGTYQRFDDPEYTKAFYETLHENGLNPRFEDKGYSYKNIMSLSRLEKED